ncbi:DNA circularization N-terminal domain-containing protein, partial [Neisseria sp. P0013.S009]|uniref:DNA circularization N-terminal domain-containing protein n=1 Tax=Neisseria sp. P0013.S009 TaxID=3436745 RepID=UPI003F814D02
MAWKDRLRQASFKQAAFGVEAHSSEQGRRVVVHESPGRDKPYVEDLGATARG